MGLGADEARRRAQWRRQRRETKFLTELHYKGQRTHCEEAYLNTIHTLLLIYSTVLVYIIRFLFMLSFYGFNSVDQRLR